MYEYHVFDVVSLKIQLNELRSQFDQKLQQGECFEEVKKLYMKIKELDSKIKVIGWRGNTNSSFN